MPFDVSEFLRGGLQGVQDKFTGISPEERFQIELNKLKNQQSRKDRASDEEFRAESQSDTRDFRNESLRLNEEGINLRRENHENNRADRNAQFEALEKQREDDLKRRAFEREQDMLLRVIEKGREEKARIDDREDRQRHDFELEKERLEGRKALLPAGKSEEGDINLQDLFEKLSTVEGSIVDPEDFEGALSTLRGAAKSDSDEHARLAGVEDSNNSSQQERDDAAAERIGLSDRGGEPSAENGGPPAVGLEDRENVAPDADKAEMVQSAMAEFEQAVQLAAEQQDGSALENILNGLDPERLEAEFPGLLDQMRAMYQNSLRAGAPF